MCLLDNIVRFDYGTYDDQQGTTALVTACPGDSDDSGDVAITSSGDTTNLTINVVTP